MQETPQQRAEHIAEIRAQIKDGTYYTEAKMRLAVGRMLADIFKR